MSIKSPRRDGGISRIEATHHRSPAKPFARVGTHVTLVDALARLAAEARDFASRGGDAGT